MRASIVLGLIMGLVILPMTAERLWRRYHPRAPRGVRFSPAAAEWAESRFSPELRPVAAFVADLLREQLGVGFSQLEPETRFTDDLGMTELEPVEVVLALEEDLGIEIPDEDCAALLTVSVLVHYLHHRLHALKQAAEQ